MIPATSIRSAIQGIGVCLPASVRQNDWWPQRVVDRWKEKAMHRGAEKLGIPRTAGVAASLAAMAEYESDMFNGALERRCLEDGERSSDLELKAASSALEDARVSASEIDGLISYTMCPDYLAGPTGGVLHERLNLSKRCFTLSVEAACNTFALQLALADQAIRSGAMRNVLLVTSSAYSKLMPMESPMSPWLGDGATAVVLGRAKGEGGILSMAHATEGAGHRAMVFGIPGKRWYDEGRVVGYAEDREMAQGIILGAADRAKAIISEALEGADLRPEQVDFYAGHQGGPWMRRVTQEFSGLVNARHLDTYRSFANLGAANIPFILSLARAERLLREGDIVATFSAGTGLTYSSVVMRWGS